MCAPAPHLILPALFKIMQEPHRSFDSYLRLLK
jgi:hypothetical protein